MKKYAIIQIIDKRTGEIFEPLQAYTIPEIMRKIWIYIDELNDCDTLTISTENDKLSIIVTDE